MARQTHHVVHDPNGGWNVKRGGAQRASGHYATKEEAIKQLFDRTNLIEF